MSSGQWGLGHRRWVTSRPHEPMEASNSESSVSLTWDHTVCQQTHCPVLITSFWILLWVYPFFLQLSQQHLKHEEDPLALLFHPLLKPFDLVRQAYQHIQYQCLTNSETFWFLDDPSPLDFPEDARPFTFHSKCKFSVPRCTPDRIIAIDLPAISTPGHPRHSHHKAPQDFQSWNASSGISLTHMVIFINTHHLLQQCLCPLNYNIIIFLNSSQPEWTSDNDPTNLFCSW